MHFSVFLVCFSLTLSCCLSHINDVTFNLVKPYSFEHSAVFIHAMVGIFKKKRGTGTWGHGLEILIELIDSLRESELYKEPNLRVMVSLLGNKEDLAEAISTLNYNYTDVTIVATSNNFENAEFPTLHALQTYANDTHHQSRLLYLHTKGVRRNGWNADYPVQWRRYMTFFLVDKYHVCKHALAVMKYSTCGVLKQDGIYQGNFWWTTAKWYFY